MTKKEAIAKIEHALLTENAQIIVPKGKTYEEHVLKLSEMLLGQVIEPVRVKVTSSIIEEVDFDNYKNSEVWAIARTKDNWLLTISGLKEFSLGRTHIHSVHSDAQTARARFMGVRFTHNELHCL